MLKLLKLNRLMWTNSVHLFITVKEIMLVQYTCKFVRFYCAQSSNQDRAKNIGYIINDLFLAIWKKLKKWLTPFRTYFYYNEHRNERDMINGWRDFYKICFYSIRNARPSKSYQRLVFIMECENYTKELHYFTWT